MSTGITLDDFKLLSPMPASFVAEVETKTPGYTLARAELALAHIWGKLRKRYDFPTTDTTKTPVIVKGWIVSMVTPLVFLKRGISGTDEQWAEYIKAADAAVAEVNEAADAQNGKFDLPLRNDDTTATGIVAGGPMVYSEASPYVWGDIQLERGRAEDDQGEGTTS